MKALVVINARHTMIDQQEDLLDLKFGRNGWDVEEINDCRWEKSYYDQLIDHIEERKYDAIVFISATSYMIASFSFTYGRCLAVGEKYPEIFVMHSDERVERKFSYGVRYIPDKNSYRLLCAHR